ncbi:MAG: FAD-dependent oxidoreductase [Planctomycetes bacterium]|nr:FAD-dependent oxidoreductase [Planctomycetota bacterium]
MAVSLAEVSGSRVRVEVPDEAYWRRQIKCQDACPVHTDARGYVRAIARGDYEQAYLIARGPNPLASICGRVCGAPCEAACRRGDVDQSISIRALKRFVTQRHGVESRQIKPLDLLRRVLSVGREKLSGQSSAASEAAACEAEELGRFRSLLEGGIEGVAAANADGPKVAIIGSGPAGLAAAHDLALLGCRVVVFEMEPIPAGMLAVGIPAYRLPRDLIKAEVELIEALGVEFRCSTEVGSDIGFDAIRSEYAAVVIAVGAKRSRRLELPGAAGPGVLGGVEFLRDVALDEPIEMGKRVVVIGGGNVAYDISRSVIRQAEMDVSRSAMRQAGVGEVHMVSLESLEELPADDVEILEGDEEGVIRHHRWGPVQILRNEAGHVSGIEFKRATRVFDENGRFAPEFAENERMTVSCDTVMWAIGQQADLSFVTKMTGGDLELNGRGLIDCRPDDLSTSAAGVFLAGDLAHGPRLLIDAVASGKKAARSVYAYVTGRQLQAEDVSLHLPILEYSREADYEKTERLAVPTTSVSERLASQESVVERGYDEQAARCEAGRCFDCGVNTIFDSEKCVLCGGCADVCPERCLRLVSIRSLVADEGVEFDGLLESRFGSSDEAMGYSAIVKDETKCIRCALCAERCPVGAITMERYTFGGTWNVAAGG